MAAEPTRCLGGDLGVELDPDERGAWVVGEQPVEDSTLAAADVDDDVVRSDARRGEERRQIVVGGVCGIEGAKMGVARPDRASEWTAEVEVDRGIAGDPDCATRGCREPRAGARRRDAQLGGGRVSAGVPREDESRGSPGHRGGALQAAVAGGFASVSDIDMNNISSERDVM